MLPTVENIDDYRPFFRHSDHWRKPVDVICDRHNLSGERVRLFEGSSIVAAVGDTYIVKLTPPFWREDFRREKIMLPHLSSRLDIQTPEIIAIGELENWPYLVLSRVEGVSLEDAWPNLSSRQTLRISGEIGELIAALQDLPIPAFFATDAEETRWQNFVESRIASCVQHHCDKQGPERWVVGIDKFLRKQPTVTSPNDNLVVLHADLIRENVFIAGSGDSVHLAGVIDFGDAMIGNPLYELAAPCLSIVSGNADGLEAMLNAAGLLQQNDRSWLQYSLMSWFLLHQFSNLNVLIDYVPAAQKAQTLEELMSIFLPIV